MIYLLSQVEINGDGIIEDRDQVHQRMEMKPVNGKNLATLIYETDVIPIKQSERSVSWRRRFNRLICLADRVRTPIQPTVLPIRRR